VAEQGFSCVGVVPGNDNLSHVEGGGLICNCAALFFLAPVLGQTSSCPLLVFLSTWEILDFWLLVISMSGWEANSWVSFRAVDGFPAGGAGRLLCSGPPDR